MENIMKQVLFDYVIIYTLIISFIIYIFFLIKIFIKKKIIGTWFNKIVNIFKEKELLVAYFVIILIMSAICCGYIFIFNPIKYLKILFPPFLISVSIYALPRFLNIINDSNIKRFELKTRITMLLCSFFFLIFCSSYSLDTLYNLFVGNIQTVFSQILLILLVLFKIIIFCIVLISNIFVGIVSLFDILNIDINLKNDLQIKKIREYNWIELFMKLKIIKKVKSYVERESQVSKIKLNKLFILSFIFLIILTLLPILIIFDSIVTIIKKVLICVYFKFNGFIEQMSNIFQDEVKLIYKLTKISVIISLIITYFSLNDDSSNFDYAVINTYELIATSLLIPLCYDQINSINERKIKKSIE